MYPSSATTYQELTNFGKARKKSTDIYKEAETKYGIPEATGRLSRLRSLVGNLTSSVEAVDPSVTGRTSGNFTTEGQRQALVSRERAPILTDLGKQQGALGQEQEAYSLNSALADRMASSLIQEDQTTYQRLLDKHNASVAAEQAAEAKRQWEATMAEQQRQFNEQQKTSAKGSGSGGGSNWSQYLGKGSTANSAAGAAAAGKPVDTPQTQAYNFVKNMQGKPPSAVVSDFNAAKRWYEQTGNVVDGYKLQYYKQLFPDILGKASWSTLLKF